MTKAQIAALVLSGAVAGAGADKLVAAALENANLDVIVHKVEVYPSPLDDGGTMLNRQVYGHVIRADGGTRDVGLGQCQMTSARAAELSLLLLESAADCTWPAPQ